MYLPKHCREDRTWDGVLCVPFEQKDAAKALGAVWDVPRRLWVVPPALRLRRSEFQAWDKSASVLHKQPTASTTQAPEDSVLQHKRACITRELTRALCGAHL
jgi:hypothetical protein